MHLCPDCAEPCSCELTDECEHDCLIDDETEDDELEDDEPDDDDELDDDELD
jgi:hypothetical protein